MQTKEIPRIEEFLHDQSQPKMSLSLPGPAPQSCGIALGRPLEMVHRAVALRVVRALSYSDSRADRTVMGSCFLPIHAQAPPIGSSSGLES